MKRLVYLPLCFIVLSLQAQPSTPRGVIGAKTSTNITGQTFAVVIGISKYRNIPSLNYADRDALVFADMLRAQGVPLPNIHLFLNEQATETNVYDEFNRLKTTIQAGDRVFFYFAGHGDIESKEATDTPVLLLHGAAAKNYTLGSDFLKTGDLKVWMDSLVIRQASVFLVLDACHSGAFAYANAPRTGLALKEEWRGQIKITSCEPTELALEGKQWGNGRGLFSYHLVEGMLGMADTDRDSLVRKDELEAYLKANVSRQAEPNFQTPQVVGYAKKIIFRALPADSLNHYRHASSTTLPALATVNSKGRQQLFLAEADSSVRRTYSLFTKALAENRLIKPATNCALYYFRQIPGRDDSEENDELRRWMKRDLVAQLQSKTLTLLEPLAKDVSTTQFLALGKKQAIQRKTACQEAIAELDMAMQLLGERHYLYDNLRARRIYLQFWEADIDEDLQINGPVAAQMRKSLLESYRLEPNAAYTTLALASMYLAVFRQDSARYFARKTQTLLPKSLAALYLLGEIKELTQSTSQVNSRNPYFEQLYQQEPTNSLLYKYLIKQHLKQPDKVRLHMKEGERFYRSLYGSPEDKALLYTSLSSLYEAANQHDKAIDFAKQAIQVDTTNDEAFNTLGIAYYSTKKLQNESIQAFKQALKINPYSNLAAFYLIMLHADRDSLDRAQWYYEQYRRFNPASTAAYNVYGTILVKKGNFPKLLENGKQLIRIDSSDYTGYFHCGVAETQLGHYQSALAYLVKADSLMPDQRLVLLLMATSYFELQKFEPGERYFQRVIQLDTARKAIYLRQISIYYNRYGDLASNEKDYPKAIAFYEKAIKFSPTESVFYQIAGRTWHLLLNKPQEGLPYLEKAYQLDSTNTDNLMGLAEAYRAVQQLDKSLRLHQKIVAKDSTNTIALAYITYVLTDLKRLPEAVRYAEKALRYGQGAFKMTLFQNAVRLYYQLDETDKVIKYGTLGIAWADSLLKTSPEVAQTTSMKRWSLLEYLGLAYNSQKQWMQAETALKEILPGINQFEVADQLIIYRLLSRVNRKQEHYEQALAFAEKVKSLAPNDPNAYATLAMLATRQHKTAEALAYLEIYLQKGGKETYFLEQEEEIANLRSLPEFAALLQKYKYTK